MNTNLFAVALAPALIGLFYIYVRDRYEKEPFRLLLTGTLYGLVITFPMIQAERWAAGFMPILGRFGEAAFTAFLVAALVEEAFKFTVLHFLTWRDEAFNEPMDGIVYAVFISLGFAGLENVLYVFNPDLGGMRTAISRAFFSVPAHGLFAVTMGYYFAMARFEPHRRARRMFMAFAAPYAVHGVYDFILMSELRYYMAAFLPFVAYMWYNGFKQIKGHLGRSPFKKIRG